MAKGARGLPSFGGIGGRKSNGGRPATGGGPLPGGKNTVKAVQPGGGISVGTVK